jgi:hypothetical protein
MRIISRITKRSTFAAIAFGYALLLTVGIVAHNMPVNAAQLTSRSLAVSSTALGNIAVGNPGSGTNGQKAKYTFTFTPSTTAISSLSIMICTSPIPAAGSCTSPTGFDASHVASIQSTTLAGSPTLDTTTANSALSTNTQGSCTGSGTTRTNCILLKWSSGTAQTASPQTIVFGGGASDYITNPTDTTNRTFYARIATYTDNAYTTLNDYGSVASSTTTQITITAKVQEALNFSVGKTPVLPTASCTALNDDGSITLGDANNGLSSTTAYDNHTYFRVSTNAINGTKIYYSGDTLKSGSNSIAAMTTQDVSRTGTAQFGLGIDSSDTQSGAGYSFSSLVAQAPYDSAQGTITNLGSAKFDFQTTSLTAPENIATSTGVITCDTGSVRYLANIATNTPPGLYTTTIDYIAVPTY